MTEEQKRDFKGIWIPKEIWLSKDLTMQEKLFYAEIESLDREKGCYASNQYFADFFDLSKTRVSIIINSLIEKGFVKSTIIYKEGSKQILNRVLNISYIPYITKLKEGIKEKLKDNNIYNNKDNNINSSNRETEKENIFEFIETNFGRMLSPIELEIVNEWEDNELTRYAIKQAVLNRALNIKYIDKILFSYKKNNIQSIIQAQEEEEKFKNKKPTYKNYKKVDNKELPEWTKEETQKEELTGDELEELKKMWEEYK